MQWLVIEFFAWRRIGNGRASYCRTCQNEYSKQHYRRYSLKHNRRRVGNQKNYKKRNITRLMEYLRYRRCVDCGEDDLRVLEFDHVRGKKEGSVAELCGRGV